MPKPPRLLCKLLIFNLSTAALYALLILVFQLEALVREAKETGLVMLIVLLVLGNVSFLCFDLLLARLTVLYRMKRKK